MTDLTASVLARRLAYAAVLTTVSALTAQAQQATVSPTLLAAVSPAASPLSGTLDLTSGPESLAATSGVTYSSSADSVADADKTLDASHLDLPGEGLQPPPRRSYGRPRYNDNSHNPDGSSKYGFVAGVGAEIPSGNTFHYYNTNYSFQVGGVRNFNKNFGVQLQFDWDELGLNAGTLTNQQNLYNQDEYYAGYCSQSDIATGNCITGLDGNAHVWSFSINPTYSLMQRDRVGAYAVVGVGFYHKVTNFTLPQEVDTIYGSYSTSSIVDHYTSNAPGFSGGFGVTYKPSKFANERLFLEARYVFMDNSQKQGVTIQTVNAGNANASNDFPANSNHTTYIPIKVGIRF